MSDLEKELGSLPECSVVLVVTSADKFRETSIKLLSLMLGKYKGGSYITVNTPYQSMVKLLKSKNINDRNLFFVDCITDYLREKEAIVRNCYFVNSPANLTEVGIALEPIFKDSSHNFLILDSVDTLAVYNNFETVAKFAHFLAGKLRFHNMSGMLLAVEEKSDEKLINELSVFCDKVIRV